MPGCDKRGGRGNPASFVGMSELFPARHYLDDRRCGAERGHQVGTDRLANATIETFAQAIPANPGINCFSCHGSNTVAVSHIYRQMNPLF